MARAPLAAPPAAAILALADPEGRLAIRATPNARGDAIVLPAAGLLRAGRLIALIPEAVIEGFTLGIAIVIATSQIKDLFGLGGGALPADFVAKLAALWSARATLNPAALAVGVATIAALFALRRAAPRIPG